jgi:hypothetical protein
LVSGEGETKNGMTGNQQGMGQSQPSPARSVACACLLALLPGSLPGQTTSIRIPASTPLSVQLLHHVPMKTGAALEGRLLYPVYVENRVAIPAGCTLRGQIVRLDSDRSHRIHSRLRGDFTPFHVPVAQFDELVLPDGTVEPITSDSTRDGLPLMRLSPPPGARKGSFISREFAAEKQRVKEVAAEFTAPGRGDRLIQLLYTQLPYHPERIEAGTAWTIELGRPADLPVDLQVNASSPPAVNQPLVGQKSGQAGNEQQDAAPPQQRTEWRLRAYLQQTISSANQKSGDTFQAMVSEPVFNAAHTLVVPQGSLLVGEITQIKRARSLGRQGKLRLRFRELRFPSGFSEPVEGTLAGVDANRSANLQIDSEGGVAPKQQNRVVDPVVLTFLAGRAFDGDGSPEAHSAVASNGFGIVGRILGIASGSRNVAAGIGYYGAALAFYDLWLARGRDVVFVKNTRIEVTTTPTRNPLSSPVP